MWIKRLNAYNRGVVMNAEGEGAGGGDTGTVLGDNADASVLFPGDAADAKADGQDTQPGGAADWKEYENDPAKSAEENATAKAAHDATKPKADDAADNHAPAPIFLMKAGRAYKALGDTAKAKECFERIATAYPSSFEARDIEKYIARTIWNMKRSGAIRDDSTWTVLRNMRQGSEIK